MSDFGTPVPAGAFDGMYILFGALIALILSTAIWYIVATYPG